MKRVLLGLGVLAAVLSTACQPPPTIDRTRPDYVRKADLTRGTWYIMDTVVGVPATSGLAFEGMQGRLEKVRFEVQEDHLVAFRVHEYIPGTDPRVDPDASAPGSTVDLDGTAYRGAPVYAWPILSHFDRQRQYNPATGEQTNVLEENTTDRPWYEREFIRVEWGRNVLANAFTLSGGGLGAEGPTDGYSPYVSPLELAEGDDALTADYVEKEKGERELVYLDFTVRQHWEPQKVDYPGYGQIPYCLFDPTEDCTSAEIRVRTSMKRVDEARAADYEPLTYDDKAMVKFGFFRTERFTYDRNRGLPESGRILLANRHNIWERAHDDAGNVIPVEQRQVRPVVYHLTANFPKELLPSARALETEWDRALRRAVAVPRGIPTEQAPQVFFLCETPVPAGAPAACGPEGTAPRIGDLRYNMLAWVDRPQKAGPLGFGPVGADPETGEIVQAAAYIYGAGMDTWAGEAQLILDVLNGDTSIDQLIAGAPVRDYVQVNLSPGDARRQDGPAVSQQGLTSGATTSLAPFARPAGTLRTQLDSWQRSGTPPVQREDRRRVVDALISQNPALESSLIELPEVRAAVMSLAPGESWRQKLQTDSTFYRAVARQTMLRMDEVQGLQQRRLDWASRHNIWLAEFSDDAFYALARSKKQLFDARFAQYVAEGRSADEARQLARADVYVELRQAALRSVAEHEVGHTLGLRHNFQGSFDALNYKDGYWQLRKESIGVMAGGKRVMPIEPADLAAAAEPTQKQVEGGMAELAYSSIMDYGARMNGDIHGIGRYDEAAILFGYAGGGELGWVEVFQDVRRDMVQSSASWETTRTGQPLKVRGAQVQIPYAQATHYTPYSAFYTDRFHYTTLPLHFADDALPLAQALDQGVVRMGKRGFRKWSELAPYYEAIDAELKSLGVNDIVWAYKDSELPLKVLQTVAPAGMPVEVPYMFCSDGEVAANVTCNRWDAGADLYEMTRDWVSRYQDYYAFSHFKRDRLFFSVDGVFARTYGRLLGNLPNVYQNWLFNLYFIQSAYALSPDQMEELVGAGDPVWQSYFTMGVFDGLNTLLRTFSAVPPGYYGKGADGRWVRLVENLPDSSRMEQGREAALVASVSGAGKPYQDVAYLPRGPWARSPYTLTETDGYDFYSRVHEVGHFWDQYAAMNALTSSTTNFLGVDRGSDALKYSLPYYITFPTELARVFSGVWTEDANAFAPALVKGEDGLARVEPPVLARAERYLDGFVYPPPPAGTAAPVEPAVSRPVWGTRYYTELYGMAFFTENFNQDYASQNQVFILGSGENVTPIDGYKAVTYADRSGGGFSYAALCRLVDPANPASDCVQPPAAASMVLRASTLAGQVDAEADPVKKAALEAELHETQRSLDIMRGLYGVFGRAL